MRAAGLETPIVWIDVEHVPDFEWSSDLAANAAVVRGAARGYRHAGYRVGVYSTPYIWASWSATWRSGCRSGVPRGRPRRPRRSAGAVTTG